MIDFHLMKTIPESELNFEYIHSSGPGGQNINKVASAVRLRFDVRNSPSISEEIKLRLIKIAGKRVSTNGILVIEAKRYRLQESNRQDALRRLQDLLNLALVQPKIRRPTKPRPASKEKRLEEKKKRGEIKRARGTLEHL